MLMVTSHFTYMHITSNIQKHCYSRLLSIHTWPMQLFCTPLFVTYSCNDVLSITSVSVIWIIDTLHWFLQSSPSTECFHLITSLLFMVYYHWTMAAFFFWTNICLLGDQQPNHLITTQFSALKAAWIVNVPRVLD